jgi:hypothetical protein
MKKQLIVAMALAISFNAAQVNAQSSTTKRATAGPAKQEQPAVQQTKAEPTKAEAPTSKPAKSSKKGKHVKRADHAQKAKKGTAKNS